MANIKKNVRKSTAINTNLNVGFLRGTQENLDALISNVADNKAQYKAGSFYLTTDSNRLYFAQSENKLEHLNQYIRFVNTPEDLYNLTNIIDGDIAYIRNGNILAIYETNDSDNQAVNNWVQINAYTDTDTDTQIDAVEFSSVVHTNDKDENGQPIEDSIELTVEVVTNEYNKRSGDIIEDTEAIIPATTKINKSDLDQWYNKAEVGATAEVDVSKNTASIGTTGVGADIKQKINILGGTNVTITGEKDNITISSVDTKYELNNTLNTEDKEIARINLTETSTDGDESVVNSITFTGNNDVIINGTNANEITVKHKEGYRTSEESIIEGKNLVPGDSIDIIGTIVTSNGHIDSIDSTTYKLPKISDVIVNEAGNIQIKYRDGDNNDLTEHDVSSSKPFGYNITDTKDVVTFAPLNTDLGTYFYTKNDIDNQFKDKLLTLNALSYKGVLEEDELPTYDKTSIGDVYIIGNGAAGLPINGEITTVGDMIIARGEEDKNGFIVENTLVWELIPGTEVDTTYTLSAVTISETVEDTDEKISKTVLQLKDNTGVDQNIYFESDETINITANNNIITVTHKEIDCENSIPETVDTLKESSEITIVESVEVDNEGHTIKVVNKKYKIPGVHTLGYNNGITTLMDSQGSSTGTLQVVNYVPNSNDENDKNDSIIVTPTNNNNGINNITYTVQHKSINTTVEKNESKEELSYGIYEENNTSGEFTVVTDIDTDNGHVDTIHTTTYKLPKEKIYSLSGKVAGAVEDNIATITTTLKDETNGGNEAGVTKVTLKSDSLKIYVTTTGTEEGEQRTDSVDVELVWGSF